MGGILEFPQLQDTIEIAKSVDKVDYINVHNISRIANDELKNIIKLATEKLSNDTTLSINDIKRIYITITDMDLLENETTLECKKRNSKKILTLNLKSGSAAILLALWKCKHPIYDLKSLIDPGYPTTVQQYHSYIESQFNATKLTPYTTKLAKHIQRLATYVNIIPSKFSDII